MRRTVEVKCTLARPCMDVMNFLNEAADRYPRAISLAAGRPPDRFASAEHTGRWISSFVEARLRSSGGTEETVWQSLGQYGPASGMIGDLIARLLARDEGMCPEPAELVVTNGMQEALFLLLSCICEDGRDIVLADDPTYVGLAGAASLCGVPVQPLTGTKPLIDRIEEALSDAARRQRRARALYLIPDFSNPLGRTLGLAERHDVLELARREQILLIEDTAYRAFRYEGEALPTLKALDVDGVVVQVGSFSKLFMPGPRVGYLYAGQLASVDGVSQGTLAEQVAKAKSFVSVLTSPQVQATVGGFIIENDFTLRSWNQPRIELCKANRDALLAALEDELTHHPALRGRLSWSRPDGGFFLPLALPLTFGTAEMMSCARDYGVLVCPMSYFSAAPEFATCVRLSFSNVTPDRAREGVSRLYRFVSEELLRRQP